MDVSWAIVVTVAGIGAALWAITWLLSMMFGFGVRESVRHASYLTAALLGVLAVLCVVVFGLAAVWAGVS